MIAGGDVPLPDLVYDGTEGELVRVAAGAEGHAAAGRSAGVGGGAAALVGPAAPWRGRLLWSARAKLDFATCPLPGGQMAPALSAASALDLEALAAEVAHGLPVRALRDLQRCLGLSQAQLAAAVGIPSRTLHRRLRGMGRLSLPESERVGRFMRLYYLAAGTLGSGGRARAWLGSAPKGLGGRIPLDVAGTEPGARLVEQLLGRIEHGVFS